MSQRQSLPSMTMRHRPTHNVPTRKLAAAMCQSLALLLTTGAPVLLVPSWALARTSSPSAAVQVVPSSAKKKARNVKALALVGDSGTACNSSNATYCQIINTEPDAGHGDAGTTPPSINRTITDTQTLTAVDGPSGWGAVQFETVGGNGGDADSDSHSGGAGAMGSDVTATIGSGVAAQGSNSGGILRFTAVGGNGGGGQGSEFTDTAGTSGTGGGAGQVLVTMNGTVKSTNPDSPGLVVLSQGGSSTQGDAGGLNFYGANSGDAGGSNTVTVTIGGSISTVAAGATITALGGAGGTGVDDTSDHDAVARDGGAGGHSVLPVTVTVTGSISSSASDGIDVAAFGGSGGAGGKATDGASQSNGGNGGNGGFAPNASLTISGSVQAGTVLYAPFPLLPNFVVPTYGAYVASLGGAGGDGGVSSSSDSTGSGSTGGSGGDGAAAANTVFTLVSGGSVSGGIEVVRAVSGGGSGGAGQDGGGASATAGNGGQGGAAGTVSVDIGQTPTNQTPAKTTITGAQHFATIGVEAISYGGAGGAGGTGTGWHDASGGVGGAGGNAGTATLVLESNAIVTTQGDDTPTTSTTIMPGVLVRSNGGVGGAGGIGNGIGADAGDSGKGGTGNTATAVINGQVNTSGSFAYGVLAQSIGGAGGDGGDAIGIFSGRGGKAQNGADAGTVYVYGSGGTVITTGTGSAAMVAQSIGGGGGNGGNAMSFGGGAIGGNGGAGGDGKAVTVGILSGDNNSGVLNDMLVTHGDSSTGLIAQSIGGAGGNGGSTFVASSGLPSLAIGGDGKGGGIGGTVNVTSGGVVTTFGAQSGGIVAQSIGGGGGNGGAAVALNAGVQISTSFSLGGSGGLGGAGGTVNLTNDNQVATYGSDSFGLKAQSIGGGGGQGGAALSSAIALAGDPDPPIPAISVSVAIGGSGGAGGDESKSPVTVTNNGFISTAGNGSIGIIAQSIAGGGGNGGDSSASAYTAGGDESTNISASASVGGKGGSGGTGGAVTVTNNGLIVTMGESAHGIFAQSVAGGGGVGGTGDSSASLSQGSEGYTGAITVGGSGGKASTAGTVTVNNYGSIGTAGDGARAIFAQSVGGGGGASGGGTAKANGGNLSIGVTVGGNAGSGGMGGAVTVNNFATLYTQGAEADAIFAQSIGGGGGTAGKGASSTGGGQDPATAVSNLATSLANGLGLGQNVVNLGGGVYKVGDGVLKSITKLTDLQAIFNSGALRDDEDGDGTASNLKMNATIGGQGGSGGDGNTVIVTNSGTIQTNGTKSDGIFAQSIGGGGGVGGASSFSGSNTGGGDDDGSTSGKLTVGGSGVGGGSGNTVTVTNTGAITTYGVATYGIDAQSVGGGGGKGGATASKNGALKDLTVTVGGSGGAGGAGNTVTVTNDNNVFTNEREAIGILAMSVGGGGGLAHVLSSDQGTPSSTDDIQITATIGGSGGAGGNGGDVIVNIGQNAVGNVTTAAAGGIGIVAQSVGGGGGLLTTTSAVPDSAGGGGGINDSTVIPITIGGAGGATGDGSAVTVNLGAGTPQGSSVQTYGTNAYGIVAQSVGGGGGIYTSGSPGTQLSKLFANSGQNGNGGAVAVNLNNGGWIQTMGDGSVGVLAQSIGGGGGVIGNLQNVNITSAIQSTPTAESGQGGNVTVDLENSGTIMTQGANAHGIVAQAFGGGGGMVSGAKNTGYVFAGGSNYTSCGQANQPACTGDVSVTVGVGSIVRTEGTGAYGIVAQSQGNGSNNTHLTVQAGGYVEAWKKSAGAIYVDGTGVNTIDNYGIIDDGALTDGGTENTNKVAITSPQKITLNNHTGSALNGAVNVANGSTFNNNVGATLATSSIDLGGTNSVLNNAGTIDVTGGPEYSALKVNGAFTQAPTGKVVLDVDGLSHRAESLQVTGAAKLDGEIVLRPKTLTPDAIPVLSTASTADVGGLKVSDVGGNHVFDYVTSVSGNTVSVTPIARLGAAAREQSFNDGRVSLAQHLDSGFVTGLTTTQAALFGALASAPGSQGYRVALDNLSGETLQAAAVAAHAASLDFSERMNDCPSLDTKAADGSERTCAWTRGIDTETHRSASNDAAGFKGSTHTAQFGGQMDIGNGWFLGGSAGYDNSSLDATETNGAVNGNSGSVGVVLKREAGPWLFSGALDFGRGHYDTQRSIVVGTLQAQATGHFDMSHLGLHGRVAYRMPMNGWYAKPYVDVHAVHLHTSAYDETGANELNLQVQANDTTLYTVSPMIELGSQHELVDGYTLRGYVAMGGMFHNNEAWGAQSSLQGLAANGATPFTPTAKLPDSQAKANLGVELGFSSNATLRAEYGGEFASGYSAQSVSLKLNVLF